MKILIATEDPFLREAIGRDLDVSGCVVHFISSGKRALDILSEDRYDIFMTEYMMPAVNGFSQMEEIRKANKGIIVIVISGVSNSEMERVAGDNGVFELIQRPFMMEDALSALKRAARFLKSQSADEKEPPMDTLYVLLERRLGALSPQPPSRQPQ